VTDAFSTFFVYDIKQAFLLANSRPWATKNINEIAIGFSNATWMYSFKSDYKNPILVVETRTEAIGEISQLWVIL
jgi:hypothetical protein